MINIENFDLVFAVAGKNCYPTQLIDQIRSAQDQLGDKLFFHHLLEALNINDASHLYPPKNGKEFRDLHRLIVSATCQEIQKQSLLYYLLKDCALIANNEEIAELFQKSVCLPQRYWFCIQGLWCLDKLRFDPALFYLTQPALIPAVFSTEILTTLLRAEQDNLALAYYRAMQPCLDSPALLDSYFRALSRTNLTQAFYFMRKQCPSPEVRQPLLEALVDSALSLPAGEERKMKSLVLLDLPFSTVEKARFRDYLTKLSGRSLDVSQDALAMSLLVDGNYPDAIKVIGRAKLPSRFGAGAKWENISESLNRGIGARRQYYGWAIDD